MKLFFLLCLLLAGAFAIDKLHTRKSTHFKHKISTLKKSHHHRSHSKEDAGCASLPKDDWKELGRFRPADSLIHGFAGATLGTIKYQKITEGYGDVNLDLYEIALDTLPTDEANGVNSAESLFEYWRKDLAAGDNTIFVDINQCSFKAFDDEEGTRWGSSDPKTTYVTIHLARLISSLTSFSFDDGSVMCTDYAKSANEGHWIFTTIESFRDGYHPVSGSRRFGFYTDNEGKTIFYTKGVDRVTTLIDRLASAAGQVFENAHLTWVSMQNKLKEYVDSHGGAATIRTPISLRCDWDGTWGSWTEECNSQGVVEVDGGCHTTNLVMCDGGNDSTCEPEGDNPCTAPGRCVCGTVQCYCGRDPDSGRICNPWA